MLVRVSDLDGSEIRLLISLMNEIGDVATVAVAPAGAKWPLTHGFVC